MGEVVVDEVLVGVVMVCGRGRSSKSSVGWY